MKSRSRWGEALRNLGGGEGDALPSAPGEEPTEEAEEEDSDLARFLGTSVSIAAGPALKSDACVVEEAFAWQNS